MHVGPTSFLASPGLLLVVRWSKTAQLVRNMPVIPIPSVPGHPADPVAAYLDLLAASPTSHPNQPFLTLTSGGTTTVVTIPTLVKAFNILLEALAWTWAFISCTASDGEELPRPTGVAWTK